MRIPPNKYTIARLVSFMVDLFWRQSWRYFVKYRQDWQQFLIAKFGDILPSGAKLDLNSKLMFTDTQKLMLDFLSSLLCFKISTISTTLECQTAISQPFFKIKTKQYMPRNPWLRSNTSEKNVSQIFLRHFFWFLKIFKWPLF